MLTINPKDIPFTRFHGYLQGAVVPRPIAFASTIDREGGVNLSPFSFFNVFSSNPPILVFSPSRRGRDNTVKHTLENLREIPEVVINIVNYAMVEQASLTSCEFPKGVNEFMKAGLTEVSSGIVRPPRVGESPVAMECKVNQIIELGTGGGAGNLVVCEIVLMHIKEEILDEVGRIDQFKIDAVARMGGDYYLRAQRDAIFEVAKPNQNIGLGFDQLPERIRKSPVLTGNDLGKLANEEKLPDANAIAEWAKLPEVASAVKGGEKSVHELAKKYLSAGKVVDAWKTLLASA
ncbi:MAG: flavin reductase family protein [Cyclobacteriaceae bacterium]|nr:flavin reductase family protein [Cyclobacteriaceae bacterium]